MPILDVEIVAPNDTPDEAVPSEGLAGDLAEAAGSVFGTPEGRTWVRLRTLPASSYAENGGGPPEGVWPVFVTVLKANPPSDKELESEIRELTAAVALVCDRPPENVHVLYLPAGTGRAAFGAKLVKDR